MPLSQDALPIFLPASFTTVTTEHDNGAGRLRYPLLLMMEGWFICYCALRSTRQISARMNKSQYNWQDIPLHSMLCSMILTIDIHENPTLTIILA